MLSPNFSSGHSWASNPQRTMFTWGAPPPWLWACVSLQLYLPQLLQTQPASQPNGIACILFQTICAFSFCPLELNVLGVSQSPLLILSHVFFETLFLYETFPEPPGPPASAGNSSSASACNTRPVVLKVDPHRQRHYPGTC